MTKYEHVTIALYETSRLTSSTEDSDLPLGPGRAGKATGEESGRASNGSREHC